MTPAASLGSVLRLCAGLCSCGNWYFRNFRVAANLIYAQTERDLVYEDDGLALGLRFQYLF